MEKLNRKDFFKKAGLFGLAAFSASSVITACGGGETKKETSAAAPAPKKAADPCSDLSGLTDQEKATRDTFGYVAESPTEGQNCTNCNFWQPVEGKECGGCMLMKGPINPDGWCKSWAAKVG